MDDPRKQVQRITREDTGRWWITTVGSSHLLDLDEMTFVRMTRCDGTSGTMRWDGQKRDLLEISILPVVGRSFAVVLHNPELDAPEGKLGVTVRRSSQIQTIEYLGNRGTDE
ncbi:hypothetical protein FEF26_04265 [Nesterenkonia salmonea]|uniref:Uncharacterized protein n=1 Tax=Nesterenkonia salmonea TaxID=1804987 RepID=A0A5R9BDG7_9MICC|nr:hypothetical protein [Nesterenkonia salmonea]TLP98618.1 hypothetical protein FEF26_04265 [Nesterenkonia salmonea]